MTGRKFIVVIGMVFLIALIVYFATTPKGSDIPLIGVVDGNEVIVSPQITGRIVNLTSVDAFKAHPQNAHYAATKAAVVSLTRSFAHHVAKNGILVNSVAPEAAGASSEVM